MLGQPWRGLPLAIDQWLHIKTLLVCAASSLHGPSQPGVYMVNVKDHFLFPPRNRFRSHFPCWSVSWLSSLFGNSSLCHRAQGQVTSDTGLGEGPKRECPNPERSPTSTQVHGGHTQITAFIPCRNPERWMTLFLCDREESKFLLTCARRQG